VVMQSIEKFYLLKNDKRLLKK